MPPKKRMLLWDWTNTNGCASKIDQIDFPRSHISSVCNWNAWTPPELKGRAPFRPMVHDLAKLAGNDWNMIQDSPGPIVFTFNEPERAGVTPDYAAQLWLKQLVPLRRGKGKKLCSPSCANDAAGQEWLGRFITLINNQREGADYIGIHYYGPDGNAAIKYLESMHARFPNHPIIVTEIASTSRNYHEVLAFTAQLANWMDNTPWIFEYGFFGCMRSLADDFVSPAAQLMKPDGSFTELMWKLVGEQPIRA